MANFQILNRATPEGNFRDVTHKNNFLRRRNEEVDYWKKRAGWFDDDVSMQEFNAGVYDTYYNGPDDTGGSGSGSSGSSHKGISKKSLSLGLKIGAAALAIIIAIIVFRILSRRSSKKKVGSSSKSKSGRSTSGDSKSRSRSRSRARSRSRSRRGTSGSVVTSNYELMDDKSEARSKSSRRSRSRSRRRSKSSSRRSKSSSRKSSSSVKVPAEKDSREVLVWWWWWPHPSNQNCDVYVMFVLPNPPSVLLLLHSGQDLAPFCCFQSLALHGAAQTFVTTTSYCCFYSCPATTYFSKTFGQLLSLQSLNDCYTALLDLVTEIPLSSDEAWCKTKTE